MTRVRSRTRSSWTGGASGASWGPAASSRLREGRQHVLVPAQRGPGGAGERHLLQERDQGHRAGRPELAQRQIRGPVRPDQRGQLGEQLGQVQPQLQVGGGHVPAARIEQDDLASTVEQDPVRGQRPVRDPVRVQPVHRVPHRLQLGIGQRPGQVGQRGPAGLLRRQREGFRPDPDQGAQLGCRHPGVLDRVREQGRALRRRVGAERRPPGDRPAQPDQPVHAVDRARGLLVTVEHPDVEPLAAAGQCRVPPRSLARPVCPAQLGHRQRGRAERGGDLLAARPLRHGTRGVADSEPDRPAQQERDEHRQDGGAQRGQAGHRVHREGQPQRVAPAGPSAQVDDRGVGHQAGQVTVQQREVARAGRGHGDRPVQLVADAAAQDDTREADHAGRGHAGGHRLGQPPGLAADELPDGQGHRQQHQDHDGQEAERAPQFPRQPAARRHHVGLHAVRGGLGQQAGRDQQGYPQARGREPQQVTGAADPARQVVLDDHRGRGNRPGTIRPSSRPGIRRRRCARNGRRRGRWPRRPLGCGHLTIVSPGPGAGARDRVSAVSGPG